MRTRTGAFPIGFRRGGGAWQQDLDSLIAWAVDNELSVLDLTREPVPQMDAVQAAGLQIGSIDLPENKGMIAADAGRRDEAVARNAEQIRTASRYGQVNHFVAMVPDDPGLPRRENFDYLVDSFGRLVPVLEENNARIVIEGWPGPGALCCTPESYRACFDAIPSHAMGVNYDPSHLIRMGIDPLRFLREFVDRVYHVHGKDTEILGDELYEYGHEQPATFAERIPYGGHSWRYTIPGHGLFRWTAGLQILADAGYTGAVSIELEDANFHRESAAEQMGILQGALFLQGC